MGMFSGVTNWVSGQMDKVMGSDADTTTDTVEDAVQSPPDDDPSPTAPTAQPTNPNLPAPVGAQAPIPSDPNDSTIVVGHFVPQGQQSGASLQLMTDAQKHTEKFRQVVESFDEDKQEPIEWVLRQAITYFCYIAPFVVAIFIGLAIGDAFTAPVDGKVRSVSEVWGIHLLSLFLEILMPILGLATTITLKRALKDRSSIPSFVGIAIFFLAVSVGNAFALLFLLEGGQSLDWSNLPKTIAILIRSFGPLILDVGASIYLSIATVRSLKKYLADQRQKIQAVRDVNQVNIELDQTNQKAAIDRMTAIADMASKQQRAETWNQIESMQAESMLRDARERLQTGKERGGYRRSSW